MSILYKHKLKFKNPGGTSRGVLHEKLSYFLQGNNCIGECSIIPNLSLEDCSEFYKLIAFEFNESKIDILKTYPAFKFAFEVYNLSKNASDPFILFPSDFTNGKKGIPINGLIWMGNLNEQLNRIDKKLDAGFKCLKLKIGAINFKDELALLKSIRTRYSAANLSIRLDANGAFEKKEVLEKLNRLSEFSIHSIEQPIKPNQWDLMNEICIKSPIPIALDEEIIGIYSKIEKEKILDSISPQYIILKPSLIGGIHESEEWIDAAERRNIQWWVTSALESNIGLNAIAQWVFTKNTSNYQGLGTGELFTNNIDSPLVIKGEELWYNPNKTWNLSTISHD